MACWGALAGGRLTGMRTLLGGDREMSRGAGRGDEGMVGMEIGQCGERGKIVLTCRSRRVRRREIVKPD